jgi:hypothetical protein
VPDVHGGTLGFGLLIDKGISVMEKKGRSVMIDSSYKVNYGGGG